MSLEEGARALAENGLNLIAALDCGALPDGAAHMMTSTGASLDPYRRLVLIGHGGRQMWAALQACGMTTADPVDHYDACVRQRLRARSSCADRCAARMACPYAPGHRYLLHQIHYHYRCSLATLRAF